MKRALIDREREGEKKKEYFFRNEKEEEKRKKMLKKKKRRRKKKKKKKEESKKGEGAKEKERVFREVVCSKVVGPCMDKENNLKKW